MKSLKRNGFRVPLLVALSLSAAGIQAAGLGKITVLTPLGQPLRAEVDITASREELASMSARLAPSEAFKQVGIEYAPGLAAIRFTVDKRPDGQPFLRLTTDRAVNEPFLDILVELTWSSGRMVREYTMLLDPPDVFSKPATVPPTVAQEATPIEKPVATKTPAATATAAAAPKAGQEKKMEGDGGTRKVRPGDTLTKIAAEVAPAGIALDQMLVALFRRNEEAFVAGNMNRLRVGKILTIPDAATATAIPADEAHAAVTAQARDFNAYRQKLAGAVVASGAREEAPVRQRSEGKIAAKVEDKAAPPEPGKDKLEVSRTESGKDVKAFQQRIAALEEDLISRDRSLKEASSRIAELEKNLADLKKLAELKSQVGTQMQQQAEAVKPDISKPESPPAATASPAVEAKPAVAEKAPEEAKPSTTTPAVPAAEPAPAKPAAKPPAQKPKPAVVAKPAVESSFIDENSSLVYGGGGVLALLLGWLGYSSWRRKREEEAAPSTASRLSPSNLGANSVFGSTGGQAVDTGASIQTDFSQASIGAIDSDEGVDPVAEADVYMAYGRDAQAEEILVDALKSDPTRHAIHLKLLEIYSGRKNVEKFESLATDFYAQTGGVGADWETAAAMGRALDPDNKLYGGSGSPDRQAPTGAAAIAASDIVLPATEVEKLRATVALPGQLGQLAETAQESTPSQPATLDFDLDVGAGAAPDQAVQAVRAPEPMPTSLDFNLEIDAPAQASVSAVETNHLDFDLALPELETARAEQSPAVAPTIEAGHDIDFEFDIDAPSATVPTTPSPKAPSFDLSSIDLELDGHRAESNESPPAQTDEENPDVATKLELAQAYEEMGDKEGARELLQEVLHEGGSRQQQAARDRLAALGG